MDQFEKSLLQMERLFRQISNSDAPWSGTKSCGVFTKCCFLIFTKFFHVSGCIQVCSNLFVTSHFFLDWIRLYYHSKVIQQSHLPTSCLYRFTSLHRGKLIFFLQGRLHSGIDDVRNMCQITRCLAKSGHVFQNTSIYVDEKHDFENL